MACLCKDVRRKGKQGCKNFRNPICCLKEPDATCASTTVKASKSDLSPSIGPSLSSCFHPVVRVGNQTEAVMLLMASNALPSLAVISLWLDRLLPPDFQFFLLAAIQWDVGKV